MIQTSVSNKKFPFSVKFKCWFWINIFRWIIFSIEKVVWKIRVWISTYAGCGVNGAKISQEFENKAIE